MAETDAKGSAKDDPEDYLICMRRVLNGTIRQARKGLHNQPTRNHSPTAILLEASIDK